MTEENSHFDGYLEVSATELCPGDVTLRGLLG